MHFKKHWEKNWDTWKIDFLQLNYFKLVPREKKMWIMTSEGWFVWFARSKTNLIEENFAQRSTFGWLGICLHWPWYKHVCLGNENKLFKGKAQKERSTGTGMESHTATSECMAGDHTMGHCCNGKREKREQATGSLNICDEINPCTSHL